MNQTVLNRAIEKLKEIEQNTGISEYVAIDLLTSLLPEYQKELEGCFDAGYKYGVGDYGATEWAIETTEPDKQTYFKHTLNIEL